MGAGQNAKLLRLRTGSLLFLKKEREERLYYERKI